MVELPAVNGSVRGSNPLSPDLQRKCMSVKYEKFLQEQINSLDIEVSQLKGLVKAMLDTSRELYLRVEEIDDRVPLLSKEVLDEKSES